MRRQTRINKQLRVQVLSRDGYKCRMCGRPQTEANIREVDLLQEELK